MPAKRKPFDCPENLFWYLVGLIATDGCLINNGRTVAITAKDRTFLLRLRDQLGTGRKLQRKTGGFGGFGYDLNIGSIILYERLLNIGLTPRKSLTLGPLNIPKHGFADFLRGVIDGDGSIRSWTHPTNGREQWSVQVVSASEKFILWLSAQIEQLWNVKGQIHEETPKIERYHTKYTLKYGKLAAKHILTNSYYPGSFALERKRKIAIRCISCNVGWSKSQTVPDHQSWKTWTYQHHYGKRSTNYTIRESSGKPGNRPEFIFECDSRGGGTGIRARLKTLCPKGCVGSSPTPGKTYGDGTARKIWAHSSVG